MRIFYLILVIFMLLGYLIHPVRITHISQALVRWPIILEEGMGVSPETFHAFEVD